MINRRKFIFNGTVASAGVMLGSRLSASGHLSAVESGTYPVVISTWDFGLVANRKAFEVLSSGGRALDAVEQGIRVAEADPDNLSVGIGGLPDRDGHITLDACIMDETGKAGSVTFLEHIMHPVSVARKVMENTPHVMLSGEGALQFALSQGFESQDLMTDKSRNAWEEWKKTSQYKPVINIENHDTIGMLAIDRLGSICGGCSTSGLGYKMHGRVGDSPIIGAGLYVDNEIGAAVATGLGELVMRSLGAFLVVELMRNGASPEAACRETIRRIASKYPEHKDVQVAIIAINRQGVTGAYAIQKGFSYARTTAVNHELIYPESLL
jgi:isoaspartyl peptidase/L-asparaginase-like protein (Ntn-hydrolase superfamily)